MKHLIARVRQFVRNEEGTTAVEYGLVLAAIAVAIAPGLINVGNMIQNVINRIVQVL